ncbi:MAG: dienelactone hydrolase family protein [Burkholderiales bacterium]|nr:dienelactone hydrolase family protein [Burkholderiales bacterium]
MRSTRKAGWSDRSVRIGAVGAAMLIAAAAALAQTGDAAAVADFAAGPGNGSYSFASSTPRMLADAMDRNRQRPAATARGQLMLPAGPAAKVPAVLLVHGSGGLYPALADFWGKRLNEQGIAVFIIDIFGARGVKSTAEDQSLVPFSADLADSFAALQLLASHPRIDRERIAVMGFSRGGNAAWRAAVNKIAAGLSNEGLRFAAHIPVYSGGCTGITSVTVKPGVFGPAPMLWIHGDEDDYTYASDCQDFAQRIRAAGTPVEFVLIPGARHKFDADDGRRHQLPFVTKAKQGCPLEFDVDALTFRDRRTGAAIPASEVGAFSKANCTTTGATVEGDRKAREAAAKAVDAFLKQVFKL